MEMFETPMLEVLEFAVEDVITASDKPESGENGTPVIPFE